MSKKETTEQPNSNMALWEQVCKTDPKYTKKVRLGAREFTTVCAQSQVMKATELFGPFGLDWWVEEETFAPLGDNDLLTYQATLKFTANNGVGGIPLHASVALKNKDGRFDSDAYKKVATDALTKGLSKLGFNADIFLGLFDDNKYVQQMIREHAAQQPETPTDQPKRSFPKPNTEETKCLNRLWKWADEKFPNAMTTTEFSKLVYACLAKWPSTQLEEQHIMNTLTVEKSLQPADAV